MISAVNAAGVALYASAVVCFLIPCAVVRAWGVDTLQEPAATRFLSAWCISAIGLGVSAVCSVGTAAEPNVRIVLVSHSTVSIAWDLMWTRDSKGMLPIIAVAVCLNSAALLALVWEDYRWGIYEHKIKKETSHGETIGCVCKKGKKQGASVA